MPLLWVKTLRNEQTGKNSLRYDTGQAALLGLLWISLDMISYVGSVFQ